MREAGVALDDGELILIALNGLGSSYEAFVAAQSGRTDEISFAAFQGMLQAHEERFARSPSSGMIPMANFVSNNTVICQICLKKGHSAIACFNWHNKTRFPTVVEKNSHYQPRQDPKQNSNANVVWCPDSRATNHVTPTASDIQNKDATTSTTNILTANGNEVSILHSGKSCFSVGDSQIVLNDILHVPGVKKKLSLVKKFFDDNNFFVTFDSSHVFVNDCSSSEVVLTGGVAGDLYQLQFKNKKVPTINLGIKAQLSTWHARLGHCNERVTRKLVADCSLPVKSKCMSQCESCIVGKAHQNSYPPLIKTNCYH